MCLNFLVLCYVVTAVTLTFLFFSDPFTLCSIWVQVVKCLVLPFLHPSISMPSLLRPFPIFSYHLASHLWQDLGVLLLGPDLYLSNSLFSSRLMIPLLSPLYLCSGLCSAAFFIHVRTEMHPDSYLSALWRIHNVRCSANNIYHAFFSSSSLLSSPQGM